MKIIKFNLSGKWDDIGQDIIDLIIGVVKCGSSFVYPTDTVYGLGVDALRIHSVERLFKIKKRPRHKPVPVMVRDIEAAKQIAFINRKQEAVLNKVWPGQVTVILEKRKDVPDVLTAGQNTIGLRIPSHFFTQILMESLDTPITVTSANFSGQPSLISSAEVIKIFEKSYPRPDLILDAGDLPESPPSTVLDLTGFQPKILRVGPVSSKDLMKILG